MKGTSVNRTCHNEGSLQMKSVDPLTINFDVNQGLNILFSRNWSLESQLHLSYILSMYVSIIFDVINLDIYVSTVLKVKKIMNIYINKSRKILIEKGPISLNITDEQSHRKYSRYVNLTLV